MDKHYSLWVKSSCGFCTRAQNTLLERGESHTVFVMDEKLEELEKVKELWNHSTVPIITLQVGDEEYFVGGYSELVEMFENEG